MSVSQSVSLSVHVIQSLYEYQSLSLCMIVSLGLYLVVCLSVEKAFETHARMLSLLSGMTRATHLAVDGGRRKELLLPNARFQSFCHKSDVLIISFYMV